jgi:PD-(D/E)XK nuclease superfamily
VKDMRLFATDAWPLHPSAMRGLITCPWRVVVRYLLEPEDDVGPAADTGSAVHAAVAALHRGKDVAESLGVMQVGIADYPRADLRDAAAMFLAYSADPRNMADEVVYVEEQIQYNIAPAPEDPTGAQISVIGTLDQVRRNAHGLYVVDIKTSKKDPLEVLHNATFQIAAYCVGASMKLGQSVQPGRLVLPRKYMGQSPSIAAAHWYYPWRLEDAGYILDSIRHIVARVRAGDVWHVPNPDCNWCTFKSPDYCLPELIKVIQWLRR